MKHSFDREQRQRTLLRVVVGACLLGLFGAGLGYAISERPDPTRCAIGLVPLGAYCCAPGQILGKTGCVGPPLSCSEGQSRVGDACLVMTHTVHVPAGILTLNVADWEAATPLPSGEAIGEFWLDATEVTQGDWALCVERQDCKVLPSASMTVNLPVASVPPLEAEAYCRAQGGALPTGDQWLFAAAGPRASRYPWGQTGLVCRRAVFGIVDGPCAVGATHPDAVASRPDGISAWGAYDLVGNVAEWTREPDGWAARGGSFRTQLAGALKVWAATKTDQARDDVGFRCAYRTAR